MVLSCFVRYFNLMKYYELADLTIGIWTSKKNVDFMNYWKNFKTVDFYALSHQHSQIFAL